MDIPMHVVPRKEAIDFMAFMRLLEAKYGWDYRDMAGSHSPTLVAEKDAAKLEWLKTTEWAEYADIYTDDNLIVNKGHPWYKYYVAIEQAWFVTPIYNSFNRPYQDVWHWLLDSDFCDLNRGGINSIWLGDDRFNDPDEKDDMPDYVETVLRAIKEEVKDHPAFDGESVQFYVDW